jgi:hypothetical protein
MTDIVDVARRVQYTGNGSAGPFSFSFQVNATTEIKVYVDTTLKTLTTHYTVTLTSSGAGSISFTSGNFPTSSETITIVSGVGLARSSVYTTGGPLTATALETDFDTNIMILQQSSQKVDRALAAPEFDSTSIDMTLPAKDSRKGKILGFNATSGNPEAVGETATVTTIFNAIGDNTLTLTGVITGGTLTTAGTVNFGSLSDGTITATAFVDEDNMSSNSATLIPTQQSVKAYVDSQVTAQDLDVGSDSGTIAIDLDSEALTIAGGEGIDTSASGNIVTIAGEDTSATNKGIASFPANQFTCVSGNVTINASQTTITSLMATDIKIGEDDNTKIDFETADEIHFYANGSEQVYVSDGVFGPQTDSDVDLGTTSVRWKDAYIDTITTTGNVSVGGSIAKTGDLTVDVSGDINIDAGGANINFFDDGTMFGFFIQSSGGMNIGGGTNFANGIGIELLPDASTGVVTTTINGPFKLNNNTLTMNNAQHTFDCAGDLVIDTDQGNSNQNLILKDGGTTYASLTQAGGELVIKSGSTPTTALTFAGANSTFSGTINTTGANKIQFGDSGTYIHQSADGVLDLVSDTEIEINAPTVDVNGQLYLIRADGESDNEYIATFKNEEATNDRSYGVLIHAGSTDTDRALVINDHDGSNPLFYVHGNGRVGIGTTSANNTLDVNGGIVCSPNTDGKDTFELSTNDLNEGRLRIKNVDTTTVQIRAGGDSYFNGGNVGIGTSSPAEVLEVYHTTSPAIQLNDGGDYQGIFRLAGNDLEIRGSSGNMEFYNGSADGDSSAERMRINSDGALLVGTTDVSAYDNSAESTADNGLVYDTFAFSVARYNGTVSYLNRTGSDGDIIDFRKNGASTGGIGVNSTRLLIQSSGDASGIRFDGASITPFKNGSGANGTVDLGYDSGKFKDLHLSGTAFVQGVTIVGDSLTTNLKLRGRSTDQNFYTLYQSNNGAATNASFGTDASNDTFNYQVDNHAFQNLASNVTYMKIDSNGVLLVGKTSSNANVAGMELDGTGNITATKSSGNTYYLNDTSANKFYVNANGGIYNYQSNDSNLSDEREKKNIATLGSKWDAVKKWDLKEFHYNSDADSDSKKVGVIAQDLESDHPDLVTEFDLTDTTKRKAVKEQQMTWMAIKALQEAMTRIETLEAKVATLEGS